MTYICARCRRGLSSKQAPVATTTTTTATPLRDKVLPQKLRALVHEQTSTFDSLREQADVADVNGLGTKLVDDPALRGNFSLWWGLLGFKRRVHADQGVKDVWRGLRMRNVDLPVRGPHATRIWRIFLGTGFRDEEFLEEVWGYIDDLDRRRGRRWTGMYQFVVGHFLVEDGGKARVWHRRLYLRHAPSSWPGFVTSVLRQRVGAHVELREIHATLERPAGLYGTVVPLLCSMGLFAEAMKWHRHCVSFGDLPGNTATADKLVGWAARYGSFQEVSMLVLSFTGMGVRVKESSLVALMVSRPKKFEALRFILARSTRVDRSAMGDRFWAAVLGQTQLGTAVIFRYMQTFGGGLVVGWRAVEALKKRTDCSKDRALALLAEFGMCVQGVQMVPDAEPSVLADRLTQQIGARGLRDVEELEFLLKESLDSRNWDMFDAALSLPSPGGLTPKVHDLILQSQLRRGALEDSVNLLDHMRKSSIAVSTTSLKLLIRTALLPRKRAKNPNTMLGFQRNDNLFNLVGILTSLLRSGATNLDPVLWREILKRLGMKRRLSDLETLATGLVEWYHPTRSAQTRRRFSSTLTPEATTPDIPPQSPQNPLRQLFPAQFIHAIIQWGFLTFRPHTPQTHPFIPPPPDPLPRPLPRQFSEFSHCVAKFTWGVALARDLKSLGVHVDPRSVTRAVRTRLAVLYDAPEAAGQRRVVPSGRRINRMAVALNHIDLSRMVDIVEAAWEGRLWRRVGWGEHDSGREKERNMRREVLGVGVPSRVVERLRGVAEMRARARAKARRNLR